MCNTWQFPSNKKEEIGAAIIDKLPKGIDKINVTGGEPGLREDLLEIITVLRNKAKGIDISTNGYFTERLVQVGKKCPDVAFRVSVEGLPKMNDELRGIKDGYEHALRTVIRLKEEGVRSVGFGIVISDKNKDDLLDLYRLCSMMGIEFGSSTMHNSFYFHKMDNEIKDVKGTVEQLRRFIEALLTSNRTNMKLRIKDWGRAYINYGLLKFICGEERPIPCAAGKDLFFLDPFGYILACNGSDEPWVMGDLKSRTFEEIWASKEAEEARKKVAQCTKNCWMVGSARPAMRNHPIRPVRWILRNKMRLSLKKSIWD